MELNDPVPKILLPVTHFCSFQKKMVGALSLHSEGNHKQNKNASLAESTSSFHASLKL
jgi:hypothetical protein